MVYPEIPKSKIRPTYVAAGIFAFLFGVIVLGLYIPGAMKYCLNMNAPWDWNSIGINGEMLQGFSFLYINTLVPVVLIFATAASFFIGRAKSSIFMKSAIMATLVGLLVRYIPIASFDDGIRQIVELVFAVLAVAFVVVGFVFRFKGSGKMQPYRANSFHMFAATFFTLVVIFDAVYKYFGLGSTFESNYPYYFPALFYGFFGVVGGIWMLVLMKRDALEFGVDPKKFNQEKIDKKLAKEQAKEARKAEALAKEQAKKQAQEAKTPVAATAGENQQIQTPQETKQPEVQAQKPEPAAAPEPAPQEAPKPTPTPTPTPTPEPAPAPTPQEAPKPNLPPLQVGPDGVKYRLITQRLPNGKVVQLRIDENGRPLPPLPQNGGQQ